MRTHQHFEGAVNIIIKNRCGINTIFDQAASVPSLHAHGTGLAKGNGMNLSKTRRLFKSSFPQAVPRLKGEGLFSRNTILRNL
jgi:hypothetical protein